MMHRRLLLVSCVALPLLGCFGGGPDGPELAPAKRVVTLGGSPLADASVEFSPVDVKAEGSIGGSGSNGVTDADGNFTMRTGSQEGTQPGKYQVRITKTESVETPLPGGNSKITEKDVVPAKYNTETTLEVEIPEGGKTDLTFDLEAGS